MGCGAPSIVPCCTGAEIIKDVHTLRLDSTALASVPRSLHSIITRSISVSRHSHRPFRVCPGLLVASYSKSICVGNWDPGGSQPAASLFPYSITAMETVAPASLIPTSPQETLKRRRGRMHYAATSLCPKRAWPDECATEQTADLPRTIPNHEGGSADILESTETLLHFAHLHVRHFWVLSIFVTMGQPHLVSFSSVTQHSTDLV